MFKSKCLYLHQQTNKHTNKYSENFKKSKHHGNKNNPPETDRPPLQQARGNGKRVRRSPRKEGGSSKSLQLHRGYGLNKGGPRHDKGTIRKPYRALPI